MKCKSGYCSGDCYDANNTKKSLVRRFFSGFIVRVVGCIISILILTSLCSTPSKAQAVCGKRTEFVERLGASYAESSIGLGLVNNGSVIEVLSSPDGKTWTILITKPDGMSCVVATGEAWERLPLPIKEEPKA